MRNLAVAITFGLVACAAIGFKPVDEPSVTPKAGAVTSHIVVISIDGLRPDAISRYNPETLLRLQREGAAGIAATVVPSKTLPAHTSMLTGVTPEVHGVLWNSEQLDERGYVRVPTVFEIAHQNGFSSAGFFSKPKFKHLEKPGSFHHSQSPTKGTLWMSSKTVADVQHYLKFNQPNLLFVHIAEPDFAGHAIGWMSPLYRWAVRRADAAVAVVLERAEATFGAGNYTVIVTADHGGRGRDHAFDDEFNLAIPWIVWGRGVEPSVIEASINTMDTAATILWLLGTQQPEDWSGRAVVSAFTPAARLAAETAIEAAGLKAAAPR